MPPSVLLLRGITPGAVHGGDPGAERGEFKALSRCEQSDGTWAGGDGPAPVSAIRPIKHTERVLSQHMTRGFSLHHAVPPSWRPCYHTHSPLVRS